MNSPVTTPLETAGLPLDNLLPKREPVPELLLHHLTPLAVGEVWVPPLREELKERANDFHPYLDASLTHIGEAEPVLDLVGLEIHGRRPVHGRPHLAHLVLYQRRPHHVRRQGAVMKMRRRLRPKTKQRPRTRPFVFDRQVGTAS